MKRKPEKENLKKNVLTHKTVRKKRQQGQMKIGLLL